MNNLLNLTDDFPYAYETHVHTKEGSACAVDSGSEIAKAYKEAGYTGIIITDHFFYGNTAVDRNLSWCDWVEGYCKGYEIAKKAGDEIGLQVFFGWEAGYQATDFLVYGLDKEWLLKHPEIKDATIEEQYKLVHEYGGMVIHAHPFREEDYIPEIRLFPEYVDGVEGINAKHVRCYGDVHGIAVFDTRAQEYARKYDLPQTGGSDVHNSKVLYGGGMAFSRKLEDIKDYIKAVKNREGILLPKLPLV